MKMYIHLLKLHWKLIEKTLLSVHKANNSQIKTTNIKSTILFSRLTYKCGSNILIINCKYILHHIIE